MKTKFSISDEIFLIGNLSECYDYYEKNYKEQGWQIDQKNEEVFMIIDKEINLKEGDWVDVKGVRLVTRKVINVLDDIIEYILVEEGN